MFARLMHSTEDQIVKELNVLESAFKRELSESDQSVQIEKEDIKRLFLRIKSYYPNDIGCFSVFLMNYVKLQPGQCIFIDAGEPHCYLSGGMYCVCVFRFMFILF